MSGTMFPQYFAYDYKTGPFGANVKAANALTTGGGIVAVIDSAFEPQVLNNVRTIYNAASYPDTGHGTAVASLVVGDISNLNSGIAPGAQLDLYSYASRQGLSDSSWLATIANQIVVAEGLGAWVINNSWGSPLPGSGAASSNPYFSTQDYSAWYSALNAAVGSGRSGQGSIVVFGSGDSKKVDPYNTAFPFLSYEDVSLQAYEDRPLTILVGGIDQSGLPDPDASPGSALLVSDVSVDVIASGIGKSVI